MKKLQDTNKTAGSKIPVERIVSGYYRWAEIGLSVAATMTIPAMFLFPEYLYKIGFTGIGLSIILTIISKIRINRGYKLM